MTDEIQNAHFPLGKHHRSETRAHSGKTVDELTVPSVLAGDIEPDDLSTHRDTLLLQAQFAEAGGYGEVAQNLKRAAEMTRIPNSEILQIYEALRPGRSGYYELLSLSQRISSQFDAELTGAYIREAADVLRDTGLLKLDR